MNYENSITRPSAPSGSAPETLAVRTACAIAVGDAAIALFVTAACLHDASNLAGAAIVVAALICAANYLCGLYKISYSLYARDEIYYACTATLAAAVPVALALGVVGEIAAGKIALVLLLCAIGTSLWHAGMYRQRHGAFPLTAGIASITPAAWRARESAGYQILKRCFDVAVALVALAVTSPFMIAAAIAVFAESGRPVLFKQQRVGQYGRTFTLYKFRTMRRDAGSNWASPGDPRITRTGAFLRRTSIDELPQLFNVLRGEMSIVGPRPEMVDFARRFAQEFAAYDQRHIVAPGITGMAQVYFKRNLQPDDVKEILRYDLLYVEHASVVRDCAILLKTIAEVLLHRAV
jgi:lipopolysaccharide/colanic/teichoic acid biosynthesis glycosyltransferase